MSLPLVSLGCHYQSKGLWRQNLRIPTLPRKRERVGTHHYVAIDPASNNGNRPRWNAEISTVLAASAPSQPGAGADCNRLKLRRGLAAMPNVSTRREPQSIPIRSDKPTCRSKLHRANGSTGVPWHQYNAKNCPTCQTRHWRCRASDGGDVGSPFGQIEIHASADDTAGVDDYAGHNNSIEWPWMLTVFLIMGFCS